jgi:hypothetical protein
VWALDQAETELAGSAAALERQRQVRFLLHFAGDVHQPLHAATYFSAQFPSGDRGGNSWPVAGAPPAPYPITELHALWDEGAGQWTANLYRPLNASGRAWLRALGDRVRALHPPASLAPQIALREPMAWANESYTIADEFVYTAPQAPTPLPAAYLSKAADICLERLAIAGYRLATALEALFGSNKTAGFARVRLA